MNFQAKVKIQIEKTSCSIHGQFPVVTFSGNNVEIACCCLDFKIKCYDEIIKQLEQNLKSPK